MFLLSFDLIRNNMFLFYVFHLFFFGRYQLPVFTQVKESFCRVN